jgi:hypothetical protein
MDSEAKCDTTGELPYVSAESTKTAECEILFSTSFPSAETQPILRAKIRFQIDLPLPLLQRCFTRLTLPHGAL